MLSPPPEPPRRRRKKWYGESNGKEQKVNFGCVSHNRSHFLCRVYVTFLLGFFFHPAPRISTDIDSTGNINKYLGFHQPQNQRLHITLLCCCFSSSHRSTRNPGVVQSCEFVRNFIWSLREKGIALSSPTNCPVGYFHLLRSVFYLLRFHFN